MAERLAGTNIPETGPSSTLIDRVLAATLEKEIHQHFYIQPHADDCDQECQRRQPTRRSSFWVVQGTGQLRQPTAAESNLTGSGLSGTQAEWAVSEAALLDWALTPAKELEQLRLPTSLRQTVASAEDIQQPLERRVQPADQQTTFDESRFWSDG